MNLRRFLRKSARKLARTRLLDLERLEARRVMASDWRNPIDHLDVNSDREIAPLDILVVINSLRRRGTGDLPAIRSLDQPYVDVDGDGGIAPIDVLRIINYLQRNGSGPRSLSEGLAIASEARVEVRLGQDIGTRKLHFQLDVQFDTSDTTSLLDDALSVFIVDPLDSSKTLLDNGQPGTPIFQSIGGQVKLKSGQAQWDGSNLIIDVSELSELDDGIVKFQLLRGDSDSQSKVVIRPINALLDPLGLPGAALSNITLPINPGITVNTAGFSPNTNLKVNIEDVRFDTSSGNFNANIYLENKGPAIGRNAIVTLPGLPDGITVDSPSGVIGGNLPYINFRDAIPIGGLAANTRSAPVAIRLKDLQALPFILAANVLVGSDNRPPGFNTISPITLSPGESREITLVGSDPDGDPVSFQLGNMGAALPNVRLDGNGKLKIQPLPNQIGNSQLELIATDGVLQTKQTVEVNVVADSVGTTRISGKILDITSQPLVGMRVEVGSIQGLTQNDGSFTLDLGAGPLSKDTLRVRGELFAGPKQYPFIAEKFPLLLGHDLFAGQNNVIDRPIYLPALDTDNGKTIDPMKDTMVTTPAIPGASVMVNAGNLMNQQGTPFTGLLTITEVPTTLTPASLPVNLIPDLVITIQPGEMVFSRPAPLTFPNRSGWLPGTRMDLWSINPVTGQFEDVGDMRVSADGSKIETISGGVRNSSWHFPSPPPPKPKPPGSNPTNPENKCDEDKCKVKGASIVELHSGAEIESHSLVGYMSQGAQRSWTLTYDSERADPRPIVHFGFNDTQPFANLKLVANMELTRGGLTYQVPGYNGSQFNLPANAHIWSISPDDPDAEVALQADLRSAPTGLYTAKIMSGLMLFNGQAFTGTMVPGELDVLHVNTIQSQFGSGWGLSGLKEIVENPDGSILIVDGSGDETLFNPPANAGQPYLSPPGNFSTLERLPNQTFRLTTTDKMVYAYNVQNKLASLTDRVGNATTFTYDAQGRLEKITDPVGLATTFTLDANGLVSQITDPANRVTKFEYDAAGNMTKVIDPDNTSRTWQYDGEHHMTGEIDKRGFQEQTVYDFAGRVQQAIMTDGSIRNYQPLQLRNLLPPNASIDPLSPPVARGSGSAVARYSDENGNVTSSILDRAGQIVSASDGSGRLPSVQRNNQNEVIRDTDGRGHITFYEYDAKGNVISMRDEESGGGSIVGAIVEPGEIDIFEFAGRVGERIFYDGLPSASDDLRARLTSPSGQEVFFNHDELNLGPFTLSENGTYRLNIFGNNNAIGDYAFSLYEPATNYLPLTQGNEVFGSIDVPGGLYIYTFTGSIGQRIFYDELGSAADELRASLVTPTGRVLSVNHDDVDRGPFVLDEAGVYRLNLFGDQDSIGDYHFRLVDTQVTFASLTIGADVTGTIDLPGSADVFTLSGTVGQRLYYDALASAADELRVRIVSPSGQQVLFDHDDVDRGPYVLDEAGVYRVSLFGDGDAVGDYHFRLVESQVSFAPLTLDSDVTGTIDVPGTADVYTFTGSAGQRLYYDTLVSAADELRVYIVSPSGQQILLDHDDVDRGPFILSEPGEYRVNLFGNSDATGDYHFRLVESTVSFAALTVGAEVTGAIDLPGDLNIYTLSGTVGQRVFLDALSSAADELRISLVSPTGSNIYLDHDDIDRGPFLFDETGTYRLNIFGAGDATGDYHFRLLDFSSQALSIGTQVTGSLTPNDSSTGFQFTGTRGQRLTFDSSLAGNANWILYSPSIELIAGNINIGSDFTVTLPSAGPYSLLLRGFGGANPIPYSFQVNDVSDPSIAPSGFGVRHTGSLAAGQTMTFPYDAPAGLPILFDSHVTANAAGLRIELRDPQNQQIFFSDDQGQRGPYILDRAGSYNLTVRGDTPSSTGDFDFTLIELLNGNTSLAFDTATSDTLIPFGTRAFGFVGAIGQRFFYDGLDVGFDNVVATLYTPSGKLIFSVNADDASGPYTLTEAGGYLLLINSNLPTTPDFNFRITAPTLVTAPLTIGATISDSLNGPGDEKIYTFTGSVGQRIFYDSLQNDFTSRQRVQLIAPSGANLFNNNQDDNNGPYTLTEAGVYQLLFTGDGDATGSYSFRLLEPTFISQPVTTGTVVSDELTTPGDEKEYTFAGSVGQRLFYDSLQNDFGGGQRVQLIAPSGARIFNTNQDDNNGPYTLSEPGIYKLWFTGDSDRTGTFSFRLLEPTFVSQSITLGVTTSDELKNPGDEKRFTFNGSVGQRIFYESLQNDFGGGQRVTLITPSGATLFNTNQDDQLGPYTLTEDGSYQLYFTGDSDAIGTFSFRVLATSFVSQPLTPGASVSDQLAKPGDEKEYTIAGSVGQRIFYDSLQNDFGGGQRVQLISPSGVSLLNGNQDDQYGPIALTEAGFYRLLLTGDGPKTGPFSFRVLDATAAPFVPLDTIINGTLQPGLSSQFFRIAGVKDRRLYFDRLQAANAGWRLIAPNDDVVANFGTLTDFETTLAFDGDYLLELRGNSPTADVPFQFQIVTPNSTTAPLAFATLTTGTISEAGETDIYTFSGALGQQIVFDAQQNDFAPIVFRIIGPNGVTLLEKNSDDENYPPLTLLDTGTYQLVVDGTNEATGTYGFRLLNASTASVIGLTVSVTGTLNPGSETEVLRLNGTAGQRLRFDFSLTVGYSWDLFGPGNVRVNTNVTPGTNREVSLPNSGSYTLVIRGTDFTAPHDFRFTATDISDAPVVASGLPIAQSGNLPPSQEQLFSFSANAGTVVVFDTLDTDNDAAIVELRDPANNVVVSQSASVDFGHVALDRSGSYTLKIRNNSNSAAADFDFRFLDLATSPTILLNSTINATVSVPFETDIYTFDGVVGEQIYLDMRSGTLGAVRQRLVGPEGKFVFDSTTNIGTGPFTIASAGRYSLWIGGNEATPGDYSFHLFDAVAAPVVTFNSLVTDAVQQGLEADLFRFTGVADQLLSITTTSPAFNARARLYDQANQLIATIVVGLGQIVTLPENGEYLLVIDGDATFTQSYTLLVNTSAAIPIPILPSTIPSTNPGKVTYTYDTIFSQETSMTDELGRQTLYQIDPANGNTLSITEVIGTVGGGDDLVTTYTYTPHGLIDTMTDPLGRVTDYDYDPLDRLIKVTAAAGTPDQGVIQYEYDTAGNSTAIIDENSHRTEYQYNLLNRITKMTEPDPDGAGILTSPVTQYVYDANGNPTQVTDPRNNIWTNQYDPRDRLIKAIDPVNSESRYRYDAFGNIVTIADELNQITAYVYDDRNRVIRETDPAGGVTRYSYDTDDNIHTVTDPNGNTTRYEYDARGRLNQTTDPLGQTISYEWDAADNLVSMTDRLGRRTEHQYDDVDRLIQTTDALNGVTHYAYNAIGNVTSMTDPLNHTAQYTYDARDRRTGTTDAIGGVAGWTYDKANNLTSFRDELNRVTTFSYDGLDRLTKVTNALNGMTQFAYDSNGNVISITDANNHSTQYAYDTLNRRTSMNNALGDISSWAYDAASRLIAFHDELNRITSYNYDSLDRLTRITDALNGVSRFTYDANSNLTTATDELNRTTRFTYDALDRRAQIQTPLGNLTRVTYDAVGNTISLSDPLNHMTQFVYDALNRQVSSTDPNGGRMSYSYDAVGNTLSYTDELNRATLFSYDGLDRFVTSTNPLNNTTVYVYDAVSNLTSVTDPLTHSTSYAYDVLNRRTSVTDANNATTTFDYDAVGNLKQLVDPVNNTTNYTYDSIDQLLQSTNQNGDARTYVYDAAHNLTSQVDRNGRKTTFSYDSLNRQIAETWLDASNQAIKTLFLAYDAASQLNAANDNVSRYGFTYDLDGRNTSVSNVGTAGVPDVVFNYAYDAAARLTSRSETINAVPGATNAYSYDVLDRVTQITQTGASVATKRVDLGYNPASELTSIQRFTDVAGTQPVVQSTYTHDAGGRLASLTHQRGPTALAAYTWSYDTDDRLTQSTSPDGTSNYSYDARGQLLSATNTAQPNENYGYDANGNRNTSGNQTAANNRLTSDGINTYEYDQEGNRTKRTEIATGTITEYQYDHRNRLVSVVEKNSSKAIVSTVEYVYDVFNRRIAKTVDSDGSGPLAPTIDRFVYDGVRIALQFDGASALTHRYLHGPIIDQVFADENAVGEVLWPLTDHLGTVRDLVDSSGTVVNHIRYDSFGNIISETNAAIDHLFGFTGRERDEESGLVYFRARYYDPAIGRFISEDPISFAGGDANLSRYVKNGPTNATDPLGLAPSKVYKCTVSQNDDRRKKEDLERDRKRYEEYKKYLDRERPIDHRYDGPAKGPTNNGGGDGGGDGGGGGFLPGSPKWREEREKFLKELKKRAEDEARNDLRDIVNETAKKNIKDTESNPAIQVLGVVAQTIQDLHDLKNAVRDIGKVASVVKQIADNKKAVTNLADTAQHFNPKTANSPRGPTNQTTSPRRGRRGNQATRDHIDEVRDKFLDANPDYRHTAGGRDRFTGVDIPEEYLPPLDGGKRGASYPDLTFEGPNGERVRINTTDTRADGTMTPREEANFQRIFEQTGDPIHAMPKPR